MKLNQRIGQWLALRQALLVQLCDMNAPTKKRKQTPSRKQRDDFFQLLLDYICAGHFEIYHHLISDIEQNASVHKHVAHSSLMRIQKSTDLTVLLNDKYDLLPKVPHDQWCRDLSELAESLAERFELEDLMIEHSHEVKHPSKMA